MQRKTYSPPRLIARGGFRKTTAGFGVTFADQLVGRWF